MFKFLKKILGRGHEFSHEFKATAQVYHLLDPCNLRLKRCLFIEAEVSTGPASLRLVNLAYTGEQEDLQGVTVPVAGEMVLTRYLVEGESGERAFGFKFNNLNEDLQATLSMLSVEFDTESTAEEFALALAFILHSQSQSSAPFSLEDVTKRYIEVEEMSVSSAPLSAQDRSKLSKTTISIASRILPPSTGPTEEDEEAEQRLEALISLQRLMDEVMDLYTEDQVLYIARADLKEYLPAEDRFELAVAEALLLLVRNEERLYSVDVVERGELVMRTVVTAAFQHQVVEREQRLMWTHESTEKVECWAAVLHSKIDGLSSLLARVVFDVINQESISQAYDQEDAEMLLSIEAETGEKDGERLELGLKQRVDMREIAEFSQLGQSLVLVHNNSGLSVLSDQLTSTLSLPQVNSITGQKVNPHCLLAANDNIHFLSRSTVHVLNLERGKVVQEWTSSDLPIDKICFEDKSAGNMLIGVNSKAIFALDPRLSKGKIAAIKTYAGKQAFSAVTSVPSGGVCAGTKKGEIKLFKQVGQIAKTSFPGLGEAVTSVDVTDDGKWVLGTTPSYLLLLQVWGASGNGFQQRLGKSKRTPLKLTLQPTDMAKYQLTGLNFTPATFNRGGSEAESLILTSTGQLLVIWDFAGLRDCEKVCYEVHPLDQALRQTEFRQGESREIVMAGVEGVAVQVRT